SIASCVSADVSGKKVDMIFSRFSEVSGVLLVLMSRIFIGFSPDLKCHSIFYLPNFVAMSIRAQTKQSLEPLHLYPIASPFFIVYYPMDKNASYGVTPFVFFSVSIAVPSSINIKPFSDFSGA
ncbi:hypothetical protein ACV35P_33245, partial [Pseudomonas aeruginosa]